MIEPYYQRGNITIYHGDSFEIVPKLGKTFSTVITDPPYGLEFMGRKWDSLGIDEPDGYDKRTIVANPSDTGGFQTSSGGNPYSRSRIRFNAPKNDKLAMQLWHQKWGEVIIGHMYPGGIALVYGGTRTHHRMMCGIEDAGFEIRDCLFWAYGSGFPKSLSLDKAIDGHLGVEREVVGSRITNVGMQGNRFAVGSEAGEIDITIPATAEARIWMGYGTALKPSIEPIPVFMKPIDGTFAENALKYGVAGFWIDGARIPVNPDIDDMLRETSRQPRESQTWEQGSGFKNENNSLTGVHEKGRWPANFILSHTPLCKPIGTARIKGSRVDKPCDYQGEVGAFGNAGPRPARGIGDEDGMETVVIWDCVSWCPVAILDQQSGISTSSGGPASMGALGKNIYGKYKLDRPASNTGGLGDAGGASRFFYRAKSPRSERNMGCRDMYWQASDTDIGFVRVTRQVWKGLPRNQRARGNIHPTVKPISLMEHLCTLTKMPAESDCVLDPFLGSGTTLIACFYTGRHAIGIELHEAYCEIAARRIDAVMDGGLQLEMF